MESKYCPFPASYRVEDPVPAERPAMDPQTRVNLQAFLRGEKPTPAWTGPMGAAYLDSLDRMGIPYRAIQVGPIA